MDYLSIRFPTEVVGKFYVLYSIKDESGPVAIYNGWVRWERVSV